MRGEAHPMTRRASPHRRQRHRDKERERARGRENTCGERMIGGSGDRREKCEREAGEGEVNAEGKTQRGAMCVRAALGVTSRAPGAGRANVFTSRTRNGTCVLYL